MGSSKTRWSDVTEAELAATGKVKRGSVGVVKETQGLEPLQLPQEARSKYGAVRTERDGISFHSAKEAKRYGELKLLEKAGQIARLKLQQRFELVVPQTDLRGDYHGLSFVCIGHYIADFSFDELSVEKTQFVVEDVKGFKTPMYRWKKKHFEAQYGIQIREV